jgi:hypothetical protein
MRKTLLRAFVFVALAWTLVIADFVTRRSRDAAG